MARRTKEDAVATRNSLLDAAEQVFYEQGVARASLSEIAQRAGATRGAVYWHFKDKLDLFFALLDRVTFPLEQAAYGEHATRPEGLERIRFIAALVFGRMVEDERTRRVFEVLLLKVEYVGELVQVQERNLAAMSAFAQRLEASLRIAEKEHGITMPMEAPEAAVALRAVLDGLFQNWLMRKDFDLRKVGMKTVDLFLRGLGFDVPLTS